VKLACLYGNGRVKEVHSNSSIVEKSDGSREVSPLMHASPLLPLPTGLEIVTIETVDDRLQVQVISTKEGPCCPLCGQRSTRVHSHYTRKVAEIPSGGFCVQLLIQVRKCFCENATCPRKIFTERFAAFVKPWARMTTRLCQVIQAIGLATGGRLGVRLGDHLGIHTSRMTIVRRVMNLPPEPAETVSCLGIDDFSFRRGRIFGTVLVNLEEHRVMDLLPDRQAETATTWMKTHPEITHVSRDRGSEYASAASAGAPQAIQVADRFHVAKNLSEAVQQLLARVLLEMKTASQGAEAAMEARGDSLLPLEEWRPAQEESVKQIIATRRAERQDRYQQVIALCEQGLTSQEIAVRLGMKARTVRDWLHKGVAPDIRPRRKYRSDFDPYAPYVLKRWQEGEHSGRQLWREVMFQGYTGSERMVYRFLETLKTHEIVTSAGTHRLPHYTSTAAVWLFIRHPDKLDEIKREDLAAFRLAHASLNTTYQLVQDFLQMMRRREGERLDAWLAQVQESQLPELQSFAHGVEQDKAAVQAGLTLPINNGQVEGQVTKIKLIKRMMYGRAGFLLLRQRVLHAL
jgi:transposase